MVSATLALERLRAGNRRFVSDELQHCSLPSLDAHRRELVAGQAPFAVIIGCADSRVPIEIVFDQGLGDLFIIRVAGNVVGPSVVGSVEYAVAHLGTRLAVVLGHSRCGAVAATLEEVQASVECPSPSLCSILGRIRPSVEAALASDGGEDQDLLLQRAVRANVAASVNYLRRGSPILSPLIEDRSLAVIGAEYSVETGRVAFVDKVGSLA